MEDGSLAVGLFNLAELPRKMKIDSSQLGIQGRHRIRDLWRQKDLGFFNGSYSVNVPRHGVTLVRLSPVR
jgi:alpha-galactosidase